MAVTAWPVVVQALVNLLPTLPGWSNVIVFDGPPVLADAPNRYATVGHVTGEGNAGSYRQERGLGDLTEESGEIFCEVVCVSEGLLAPVRTDAFALVAAWQAAIEADQTLGVLRPSSTCSLSVEVQPAQTTGGAAQRLIVTLNYFSRS